MSQANVKAVISAEDRASSVIAGVGGSFGKLAGAMAAGQLIADGVARTFDALKSAVKGSTGAAFDQVRQVQNATIALKAYEKDGNKVNTVLKDLIAYARSDMGVLFQREDLFAAAQTLKLYGQSTESLTDKVKILSKGVSLGKTTFQELSSIVGRAAAKGRLDAVDFDMLIERGIGLDKSMRGAAVTSEKLFKALDKALPAELLAGRAKTIDGMMIRLKSAFRDVGSTILGVNRETSEFIEGGLGDRFVKGIGKARDALADPRFKKAIAGSMGFLTTSADNAAASFMRFLPTLQQWAENLNKVYIQVANYLEPKLVALWHTLEKELMPTLIRFWKEIIVPLAPALGTVLVVALGLVIDAFNLWANVMTKIYDTAADIKNFFTSTLPPAIDASTKFIVEKFNYLKANWERIIGEMIGVAAVFTYKLPLIITGALVNATEAFLKFGADLGLYMTQVWDKITNSIVTQVRNLIKTLTHLNWGDILKSINNSISNSITGLIEGIINGVIKSIPGAKPVKLPRYATGTNFAQGGMAMVGEQGAEVVNLPRGSTVTPANSVNRHGGGQPATINITVQAGAFMGSQQDARAYAKMIADSLKDYAVMNGRTVSQVLGT